MIDRATVLVLFFLGASVAAAKEPRLYKLRFREGAEHCAVAQIPGSWQYPPERLPTDVVPGQWELRKDAALPTPGYLLRWNGEFGFEPDNYSLNVFRFEWTGDKPRFFQVARRRWAAATRMPRTWEANTYAPYAGGDDPKVLVTGRSFLRTGRRWMGTADDAILTGDQKWLVLQSTDGRIVHRTLFGEGPDLPLAGRIHVDVYHVRTGQRRIQLEIDQTEDQGLSAFLHETSIFEGRFLFLRIDPRPKHRYYLACRLPAEP